jgi:hypothetical protein
MTPLIEFALCCFMLYVCPVPILHCLKAQVMAMGTAMKRSEPYGKCSGRLSMLAAIAGFWFNEECVFCAVLRESRSMDKTFAQRMQSKLSAPVSSAFGMPSITTVPNASTIAPLT